MEKHLRRNHRTPCLTQHEACPAAMKFSSVSLSPTLWPVSLRSEVSGNGKVVGHRMIDPATRPDLELRSLSRMSICLPCALTSL